MPNGGDRGSIHDSPVAKPYRPKDAGIKAPLKHWLRKFLWKEIFRSRYTMYQTHQFHLFYAPANPPRCCVHRNSSPRNAPSPRCPSRQMRPPHPLSIAHRVRNTARCCRTTPCWGISPISCGSSILIWLSKKVSSFTKILYICFVLNWRLKDDTHLAWRKW